MFQSLTAHFVSTEFRTKQNSLCMKITVNNKETEFDGTSVSDLAVQLQLPEKGVAVAVNNEMIPRSEWSATPLAENANVVIIKAACGG